MLLMPKKNQRSRKIHFQRMCIVQRFYLPLVVKEITRGASLKITTNHKGGQKKNIWTLNYIS